MHCVVRARFFALLMQILYFLRAVKISHRCVTKLHSTLDHVFSHVNVRVCVCASIFRLHMISCCARMQRALLCVLWQNRVENASVGQQYSTAILRVMSTDYLTEAQNRYFSTCSVICISASCVQNAFM